MASVADYRPPSGTFPAQLPHRKPVPHAAPAAAPPPSSQRPPSSSHTISDHERYMIEQQQQQQQRQQAGMRSQPQPQGYTQQPQQPYQPAAMGAPLTHVRSRTSSSNVFPKNPPVPQNVYTQQAPQVQQSAYQQQYQPRTQYTPNDRRTSSMATTSTAMSSNISGTTVGGQPLTLQRTGSARSGNSPLSYVALMRKQKATVWCERAQPEDPTLVRQQKMARERALREVASGNAARYSASSNSGGFTSKIRHHAPKAQVYTPSSLLGSGVPIRLSANEVDEDDSDDDSRTRSFHKRTGSERSSLGSAGRISGQFAAANAPGPHLSTGNTPPGGQPGNSPNNAVHNEHTGSLTSAGAATTGGTNTGSLEDETPVPEHYRRKDYFSQPAGSGTGISVGSSSSGDTGRENSFGGLGQMPQKQPTPARVKSPGTESEEIKRRGSVDDRTMTMSGYGKLFVANPDLD